MPRTKRALLMDMKSVKSVSFRRSTDYNHVVVTNTYDEHNGRPLMFDKATLQAMLALLEVPAQAWNEVTPSR